MICGLVGVDGLRRVNEGGNMAAVNEMVEIGRVGYG